MQASTCAVMLLLLLIDVSEVGPRLASAAAASRPRVAEWARNGVQRINRGFRFGGADRFSHGFGRRRRVNDVEVADPLLSLQAGAESARSDHEATRHRDGQRRNPSSAAIKKLVDRLF